MNKHAAPNLKAEKIAGGVATDQRHDSAHKHVSGTGGLYRRHAGAGRHAAWLPRACRRVAHAHDHVDRSVGGARGAGRRRRADGQGHSGRERHLRRPARMTSRCLPTARSQFHGQPIFCVIAETREQARRAARLAKIEYRRPARMHRRRRARSGERTSWSPTPLTLKRGDAAAAHRDGAAPAQGPDAHRRAGAFLSRRPDRAWPCPARTTRSPSIPRPSIRAKCSTWSAHALGVPACAVTVEMRRMGGGFGGKETQGNQFAALAALAAKKHRPRGQDPARPRRRHDRHRQAPRFRRRLRGRLRRRRQHPRRRLRRSRRAAASRRTCPAR